RPPPRPHRRHGDHSYGGPVRVAQRRDGSRGAVLRSGPPAANQPGPVVNDLLDLLPDGVIEVDGDRRIVAVNATATRLTGYSPDELVGKEVQTALSARGRDLRPVWADGWHASAQLRSVRSLPEQEVVIRTAAGRDV